MKESKQRTVMEAAVPKTTIQSHMSSSKPPTLQHLTPRVFLENPLAHIFFKPRLLLQILQHDAAGIAKKKQCRQAHET